MVKKTKIAVYTFGCKVNLFESEQLKYSIKNAEIVSYKENADLYIINGCTVTATSSAQVRNMARRFAKKGKVIVTGCFARNNDGLLDNEKNIQIIKNIEEVATKIKENFIFDVDFSNARPFLKIQDGCDQFCSYCIIPYVRGGKIKSILPQQIENVLKHFFQKSVNEVVLTGIHIGKYGIDLNSGIDLSDIVKLSHKYINRVRLGSLELVDSENKLIDKLITLIPQNIVLPHWHLPLQSGSDKILKLMNRPYKIVDFEKIVKKIFDSYKQNPAIGTDLIVGFPGETDKDFNNTLKFVEKMPFTYGHIFPFSSRKGTPAFEMEKEVGVEAKIKKERAKILRDLFFEKHQKYIKTQINIETEVVLEEEFEPSKFYGTTSNYLKIVFEGSGKVGELKKVKLLLRNNQLIGI
jgi:threonylcarbamoyladenosine tRNA methylthiotransferase MtaB